MSEPPIPDDITDNLPDCEVDISSDGSQVINIAPALREVVRRRLAQLREAERGQDQ
jgi:hypothetical protein